MSHAAKQIRDWFITACTGVSGLPTPTEGAPRQIASNTDSCFVRTTSEEVEPADVHASQERTLAVQVVVVGNTFTESDAMSLAAEEAIAAATGFPGTDWRLERRDYDENTETDRAYVSVVLSYVARYYVARNDVETFE